MQPLVQKKKKEQTGVIVCPRCGAGNLTAQSVCGRCGFVFPKEKATFKGRKGEFGEGEKQAPPIPPSLPGAPREKPRADGGEGGAEGEGGKGGNEEEPAKPELPKRPEHIPDRGVSEGIRKESGGSPLCPRCGTEMKEGVKRCPRCGYRK